MDSDSAFKRDQPQLGCPLPVKTPVVRYSPFMMSNDTKRLMDEVLKFSKAYLEDETIESVLQPLAFNDLCHRITRNTSLAALDVAPVLTSLRDQTPDNGL